MMKKKLGIIIGIFILTAGAAYFANAAGIVFFASNNNGLVLDIDLSQNNYNSGTKTFTDKSGFGNNGVSTNAATFTTDKNSGANKAMSFNGVNDQIAIANSSSYKTPSISVSFWVRPLDRGVRHVIFTHWTGFTTEINADRTFKWGLNGLTGQYYGTKKINWGEWVYLTGTFDDNTKVQCIYINGVKQECQTVTGSIVYDSTSLYVSGPWSKVLGDFGNMKIYNRALSSTEVSQLYSQFNNNNKPQTQVSSLFKGLIAYWPLDGDGYNSTTNRVTDKTPYANHGTNYGATLTTDKFGQTDGAMSFNGTSNYINTNTGLSFKITDSFSMSAWVKNTAQNNHLNNIISKMAYEYVFYTRDNTIGFNYWNSVGSDTISMVSPVTDITQWHLATVTYDGSVGRLYVDGVLKATDNLCSGTLASRVETAKIGQGYVWGTSSGYLNGQVSDVRVYDRTLSAEEIETLYSVYKPKIVSDSLQKGLIVDLPLNSSWTKTDTVGSQVMTNKTPYDLDGLNTGAVILSDSASFDGVSDRSIRTKNSLLLNADQSYSVWINSGPIDGALKGVFTTHNHAVTSNIGINEISNRFYISIGYLDGTREYSVKPSNFVIVPNVWTHVVLLYNSVENSVSFYVNGVFDKKWVLTKPVKFTSEKVLIGKWSTTYGGYPYNGLISSAKVYDHALSVDEIKTLFDKGK